MNPAAPRPYRGVFPVAPTIFDDRGVLDLDGQRRCIDFMIDAGSNGICILANFSEQFVLTDAERERVMDAVLKHVAGRVPVIATTTHFSSSICAARSRQAQEAGAAMVMIMPPYHGATFRVGEKGIFDFYRVVSDAIDIPIMIQDAPVAGTPLSVDLLARMAREIPHIGYFKIEVPMAAAKLRDLIADGCHDRWRLSRRHQADRGSLSRRAEGGGGRRLRTLAAADQLRKPAMRIASLQDTDEGRRRDRFRSGSPPLAKGSPGDARRFDRHRPPARPRRAALGPLVHPGSAPKWR
jgi:hypothetical protein